MEVSSAALRRFAQSTRFDVLVDDDGPGPDDPLLRLYGGPLRIRLGTPRLIANFVATVDGVTAFGDGRGEGAISISLHSAADRFVMALLRCAADCVLIGSGTLRDDPHHQWTPSTPMPELAAELTAHRAAVSGAAQPPPLAVVTASGELPAVHPALSAPQTDVLVITTEAGAGRLPPLHPRVRVAVTAPAGNISADAIVGAVRSQLRAVTILCEGGPRLFGDLLQGGWVDELFLTLAPQLAGRSEAAARPGLVAGHAFLPDQAPRLELRSLRRSGDHVFVRYAVGEGERRPA